MMRYHTAEDGTVQMTTEYLVNRAQSYLDQGLTIPCDLYYMLIERGIDASAMTDETTAQRRTMDSDN